MPRNVTGVDEYRNRIQTMAHNLGKAEDVIHGESEAVKNEMQSIAPVRTGYLRDHIVAVLDEMAAVLWSQAPYSGFVEFGTRYMTPRIFFRPPFLKGWARIKKRLFDLVRSRTSVV